MKSTDFQSLNDNSVDNEIEETEKMKKMDNISNSYSYENETKN